MRIQRKNGSKPSFQTRRTRYRTQSPGISWRMNWRSWRPGCPRQLRMGPVAPRPALRLSTQCPPPIFRAPLAVGPQVQHPGISVFTSLFRFPVLCLQPGRVDTSGTQCMGRGPNARTIQPLCFHFKAKVSHRVDGFISSFTRHMFTPGFSVLVHTHGDIALKERDTADGHSHLCHQRVPPTPATWSRFGAVVAWPPLQIPPVFQYLPVLCLLRVYSLAGNNSWSGNNTT